jgi:NitT/TauT family transport system substrate-binding protein
VRETISPDGLMPPGAQENCLKFLVDADPKLAADKDKIHLADTWTNEFAQRAKKQS